MSTDTTTKPRIDFDKLEKQLRGVRAEFEALSRKLPNQPVNRFKLTLVNSVLASCNDLMGARYRPFADFGTFQLDRRTTNSDVAFVLTQYCRCVDKLDYDILHKFVGKTAGPTAA